MRNVVFTLKSESCHNANIPSLVGASPEVVTATTSSVARIYEVGINHDNLWFTVFLLRVFSGLRPVQRQDITRTNPVNIEAQIRHRA